MKKITIISWIIIFMILILTVFFALQLPRVQFENAERKFLPENHMTTLTFNKIEETFGNISPVIIGIKADNSNILTPENLGLIDDFSKEIEKLNNVKGVDNLMNYDFIEGNSDEIIVKKIAENIPETEDEINEIRKRLSSWEMYKGFLYSDDLSSTTLTVNLADKISDDDQERLCNEIINLKNNFTGRGLQIYLTGDPIFGAELNNYMQKDLTLLLPFVIIVLLAVLFLSFRNLTGIVLPMISVIISTVWTMGLAPLINQKLTVITIVVPVIMIAIGSAYGIHIVNHYLEGLKNSNTPFNTRKMKMEIVIETLKKISLPVFLSALTTVAGFSTLAFAGLIPIREFGILSSIGVSFAFIVAMTFIPSVLFATSSGSKQKKSDTKKKNKIMLDDMLLKISDFILQKPYTVIISVLIITVISLAGLFMVEVDNNFIEFFKKKSVVRISDDFLNSELSGSYMLELLIEGKNPGDLNHPEILKAIDDLGIYIAKNNPGVKKILSYADLVKKMNETFHSENGKNTAYYEIPFDPEKYNMKTDEELKSLITQYMMLYSGNVSGFLDDSIEPLKARISILMNSPEPKIMKKIEADVEGYIRQNFPAGYTYEISGISKVINDINKMIIDIKISNIIQSIVLVMLILMIVYLSFTCGILSIIPITISVIINFGVMGFFGIKLNMATAMISSITVGAGIDYTIHFISGYKYNIAKYKDINEATRSTMLVSGKAVIFNALSVALGFAVMLFSSIYPLIHFGILMCLSMFTSSILAMFLVPVMFNLLKPEFLHKEQYAFLRSGKNRKKTIVGEEHNN